MPLDYDYASKGSVGIGVLRVTAGKPANRLGGIWMNPGGPGARGLAMPLRVSTLWLLGNSANPVGQKLLQLSDAYDLIGFDPRGVGSSAQLVCSSSAPARAISFTDRSPAGVRAQMTESRDLASACGGTPLTPYINTEYTARDMEVIRAALGYDKLNYYGTSYGTALGARYASLFPGRTGRLVLDSVVDITLPFAEVGPPQAPAFQHTFDGIIAPYIAAQNELFGLGSNADDVKEITRNGPPWLTSWLGRTIVDSLYAQWQIDSVVEKLAVAKRIKTVLAENPQISANDLHREVVSLPFFPSWNRAVENATQKIAREAVARYAEVVSGSTRSLEDPGAAQVSVTCNDGALIHSSEEYWADLENSLAMSAPLVGGLYSGQPCLYWPFSTRRLPSFDSAATLPILMLQDENDGPTPLPGARATAATLKNSRLVIQETTYDHGAFFSGSECIGGYFADYLLEGALPEKGATCAGNGLNTSKKTININKKLAANAVTEEYRTNMYTDRLEAEKVLQDLREMMR
ncbi:alpha/beta hydrolase [Paraburkholderia youngii]|uniref:alpha/beta hydrolase n=1 Tax=Paraburkholderia youngii TaxID=2782701 RepID=UPI0035A0CF0E